MPPQSDVPSPMVPDIALSPQRALRFAAAFTLFGAAMHYLVSGRKEANIKKMLVGVAPAMASMLLL